MEKEAAKIQELHRSQSDKEGMIREFLDRLLPENLADLVLGARRCFIHGSDFGEVAEGSGLGKFTDLKRHTLERLSVVEVSWTRQLDTLLDTPLKPVIPRL